MTIIEPAEHEAAEWGLMQALGVDDPQQIHPTIEKLKQEAGRLRARVEELEAQPEVAEAVRRLDAIAEDPDGGHAEAEKILLARVPPEVREAHRRLVERMPWWAFA